MTKCLQCLLLIYQKVSISIFGQRCRYYPTCSEYARQAIGKYGVIRGTFLAINRLIRCNQLFPGGYDPL